MFPEAFCEGGVHGSHLMAIQSLYNQNETTQTWSCVGWTLTEIMFGVNVT